MAWVTVDRDNTEHIFQDKPKCSEGYWSDEVFESFDGQGGKPIFHHVTDIERPKGSITELIGRDLNWGDNPVELIKHKKYGEI